MKKVQILIIDDEQNSRDVISTIIRKNCPDIELIGTADGVKTGVEAIKKHQPDLVLLDIHLKDGSGFDILKSVNPDAFKLIFITTYEEYAIKAFKFSAIDYILKPINSTDLVNAIERAGKSMQTHTAIEYNTYTGNSIAKNKETKKIVLKTHDSIYAISIKDIVRCESDAYYTNFHLADGQKIMISNTLKEFDELLTDYGFFRVHQSHLINMDYFAKFKKADGGFAVMKDGNEIPVASRRKDLFLQILSNL